ncbi:MAG: hypothetical protein IJ062_10060 [Firmicutes bacterium]|nr:hypothetical protein [Bacillota bacterium]
MKHNILKLQTLLLIAIALTACGGGEEASVSNQSAASNEITTEAAQETKTETVQETKTEEISEIEPKRITEVVTEQQAETKVETTTTTAASTIPAAPTQPAENTAKDTLSVKYSGKEIYLDSDINAVGLGTPLDYSEAPSCNYDGLDKVYTYDGISIYTYPNAGKDLINEIEVDSTSILYNNTLGIGKTVSDVKNTLGEPTSIEGNTYRYDSGNSYTYFYFENNTVSYWGIALE